MNIEKFQFDYIVVGAGPAGLQLGYFMEKNELDYCILEKNSNPGGFFEKFPKHRKLISINKINTGYKDKEINLRWDWNSLLSDHSELLLKNYSKEYFPHADDFVRYLKDFSEHCRLKIYHKTQVEKIGRDNDTLFKINTSKGVFLCKNLIIATGIPNQIKPNIPGIEYCTYYSNCSTDPNDYADKNILVMGKGNSAFEVANSMVSTARKIHLLSPNTLKFAWDTHYVGNVRAINNPFLDTYLLKSQNAILNADVLKIDRKENGKLNVSIKYTKVRDEEVEELEYDEIIVACGFKMDCTIFDENTRPELVLSDKLPNLTCEWESCNIKNLYFAGVLTHSRDYKKTTSGFIHGFRYNCEMLVKILMNKNNTGYFDMRNITSFDVKEIRDIILERVNRSSALWQQFGYYGDVLILDVKGSKCKYFEALPCDYAHQILCKQENDYFIITLEYGSRDFNPFSSGFKRINRFDVQNAHESDFLHPVIRRFSLGKLISTKHLLEDLNGEFNRKEHIDSLSDFLKEELRETETIN